MRYLRPALIAGSAVAVFLFAVAMPWYVGRMASEHTGHGMVGCPLVMGQAAICPMNLVDHLALGRYLLAAVPPPAVAAFLLAAIVLLPWWLVWRQRDWLKEFVKRRFAVYRWRAVRLLPRMRSTGTLEWALARGILHPKIYPADNQ
mgnify:CR=1 FL=1